MVRRFLLVTALRSSIVVVVVTAICSCSSSRLGRGTYAEIDATTATRCKQPSVDFRDLRDPESNPVRIRSKPIRVPPGAYAIGISCGVIYANDLDRCIRVPRSESSASVGSYKLVLRKNV